ncbi:helix-turn-helix domain-containing protein [Paraburkholderia sp. EG286B]|uniref:helix-turn-helix domain-containing protein n=1 Tax=Paraburkholderia sp. EG286B TaxID=3237011 RepID=UPI0034D25A9E
MSFHLVNLAWQKDLSHAPKIVLLALADFAQQSTGECFPSIRVLSARCGLSESAVRSQIALLERAGLLDIEKQPGRTLYRVKLGAAA